MKKFIYILFILLICSSISFCAKNPPSNQGQPPQQHRGFGPRHFGLNEEEYNKLNLSKAQKTKVDAIEKKYRPQGQPGQRPDFAQMQKKEAAKNKEFRGILTDQQKKQYDKFIAAEKKKQSDMVANYYRNIAKELKFSQSQTLKLNNMLKGYAGNPMEFNKKFETILTPAQKKTYDKKKQEMMGHGGPRPQGPPPPHK